MPPVIGLAPVQMWILWRWRAWMPGLTQQAVDMILMAQSALLHLQLMLASYVPLLLQWVLAMMSPVSRKLGLFLWIKNTEMNQRLQMDVIILWLNRLRQQKIVFSGFICSQVSAFLLFLVRGWYVGELGKAKMPVLHLLVVSNYKSVLSVLKRMLSVLRCLSVVWLMPCIKFWKHLTSNTSASHDIILPKVLIHSGNHLSWCSL